MSSRPMVCHLVVGSSIEDDRKDLGCGLGRCINEFCCLVIIVNIHKMSLLTVFNVISLAKASCKNTSYLHM